MKLSDKVRRLSAAYQGLDDQESIALEVEALENKLIAAVGALKKIYEPEKYHHLEPDDYTRAACFQFVAQEALKELLR